MKRLLALVIALGLGLAPARLAAQQIPVGPGGELSSLVGIPIEVPLVVDLSGRPERLGSFSVRLQWDPAVLRLEMGRLGSFGAVAVNEDSVTSGIIRLAGVNAAGAVGRVTLGILRLTPLANATTTLDVTLGELFAAGTFADLKSYAVVSDGLYCPARGYWGDIDKDGNANSRDALIALSNAVGLDVSAFEVGLGDVDASGTTNARDALIILSNAVGVSTSGFRVLRLAGGACAANAGMMLAIAPAGVELVSGQDLLFEARSSDGAGALQTITDVSWKSSDPAVVGIFADGRAVARGAGTAVVTVLRGTRDSAQTTVTVVARRTTHWVDILAKDARVRIGTPALPFGSIDAALEFARDGDTVRVRPGRYAPDNEYGTVFLIRPVVLMGDTAADGSRPTIVGTGTESGAAGFDLMGTGAQEVHNFVVEGYGSGVVVEGPSRVLLRGVRLQGVWLGVYVDEPVDNLRIERSRMQGITNYGESSGGNGVTVGADVDTLTIEDSDLGDFQSGVYEYATIDSLTVRRSVLHDFTSYALKLGFYSECGDPCSAPPRGPTATPPAPRARPRMAPVRAPQAAGASNPLGSAVVVEHSRLVRSGYRLVDLQTNLRRVAFSHNVLSSPGGNVLDLYGTGHGYVSLRGDSIVAPPENQHGDWLDAWYLDSLTVDSAQVVGFGAGYAYDVPLIRITNSTLRDFRDYGLYVGFGGSSATGGVLQLDNVELYGDPRDDMYADGIEFEDARLDANRVTAVNLAEGIDVECSDSSATVRNSLFRHVESPISWCSYSDVPPAASVLTVENSTFRGFDTGVYSSYAGRVAVDGNTFENGYLAVHYEGVRPVSVTRNRISGTLYPIQLYAYDSTIAVTVTDNVLTGVSTMGIYAWADSDPDTLKTVLDIRRNTVTCDTAGAVSGTGIELHDAHLSVVANQVSGCHTGIATILQTNSARRDSVLGNTVTVPANAEGGIAVKGNAVARVAHNSVSGASTGTQSGGLIDVTCPYSWCGVNPLPSAFIDTNQVTGGTTWGIRVKSVDSLDIVGNTVSNLNTATGAYPDWFGGIVLQGGIQQFARVLRNVVRHIAGNGIVIDHYGPTAHVDLNVVADVEAAGILDAQGPVAITRNLVTGARGDGIRIEGYSAASATGNHITGNLPFGLRLVADRSFDATNNWWGDLNGPRCSTGCDLSVTGDSVSADVTFLPFLAAPSTEVPVLPSGAPQVLAEAVASPIARPAVSSDPLDAPIPRRDRSARPSRAEARRSAPPSSMAAPAGPAAEHRAAQERERAAAAARRAERLQLLRARAEASARARQAATETSPRGREVRP